MKKLLLACIFSMGLMAVVCQPIVLETKKILNDKVELLLPSTFTVMADDMLQMKYPTANRPTLVYTNENGTVNIAFNHSSSKATQGQVESYKDFLLNTFKKTFPTAEWEGNGVQEINGKKVGFLAVTTQAVDTKIYNLLFFTDLDGRLLICTFNCTVEKKPEWAESAKKIFNSLVVQ